VRLRVRTSLLRDGLVVALVVVTAVTPLRAQDDRVIATECCLQMLLSVGARSVALGGALTARPGPDGIFANPAALAGLSRDEFRIHNAKTDLETTNTFGVAFGVRSAGTLGLTYRLADYGETEVTDEQGNAIGTVRLAAGVLLASFATRMGRGVSAGVSYMFYHFNGPGFNATTHGVDFGAQLAPESLPYLQLGASFVHVGLPLQVFNAEQAAPTPGRFRAGAAYEMMHHFAPDSTTALWASADLSGSWHEGVPIEVGGGLELSLDETIFVRAGYMSGSGSNSGASVGVGLRYQRFDVGIAKSFVTAASGGTDPFQITFAIGF
jgi:hypothetical protein